MIKHRSRQALPTGGAPGIGSAASATTTRGSRSYIGKGKQRKHKPINK